MEVEEEKMAAPCGLYCGACIDYLVYKSCHGCGCKCERCDSSGHACMIASVTSPDMMIMEDIKAALKPARERIIRVAIS